MEKDWHIIVEWKEHNGLWSCSHIYDIDEATEFIKRKMLSPCQTLTRISVFEDESIYPRVYLKGEDFIRYENQLG